jgi:thymidylate kinase
MEINSLFYAIEGLDGVGKTTLVNNLKNRGFDTFKSPPKLYNSIRKDLHSLKESSFFYYLSSLSYVLEVEARNSRNFFVDRYIFSTITQYVSSLEEPSIKSSNELFQGFSKFIPFPTITFFIDLDYQTRINRIAGRTKQEKLLDNSSLNYHNFWTQAIHDYSFSRKIILDGNLSEDELVEIVILNIKEFFE